jgi:hypothetical protein
MEIQVDSVRDVAIISIKGSLDALTAPDLAHHAEIIPILPEFERSIGTFSGDQIPHIIEAGVRATEKQIVYIRRLVLQS